MNQSLTKSMFILMLALLVSWRAEAQRNISGQVISDDGEPLVAVNVTVKGSTTGTITDANGDYQVQAKSGDVLIFSFLGMLTKEINVGDSDQINVVMEEDVATLSDVIVTTTRQPVRRLETTTAVNVIDQKAIQNLRPEGFSEAIQGTPGMYTSQSQGRFRGAIFTRGFPDGSGNGLVYTGILLDGLPTLATTARPPDFAFGMDPNVASIEVVRGSAATLFGRSSAAGVVNIISKVGGKEVGGMARMTMYNENVDSRSGFDYKFEGNVNGPITDDLRFNIGGYYVNDRGFRDLGYNDRGGQIRANLDYLMGKKGSIRLYGAYVNVSIQNMIDIPYKFSDNTPRDGWDIYDSFYDPSLDDLTFSVVNKQGQTEERSLQAANEDGNYARGGNIGLHFDYEIAENLFISNKTRYQSYDHGTKFNLGVSTFYADGPFQNVRVLVDGDGNDADFMEEFRLTYNFGEGVKHSISAGTFLSTGWYTPVTYSLVGWVLSDPADLSLHGFFPPPNFPAPSTGGQARIDEYTINTTAFFFGDEISAMDDKLKVNLGFRWDKVKMDIEGFYDLDDPTTRNVKRTEEHDDISYSFGANYLINPRTSVYGNFVSAFRMPDYSAYTPAKQGTDVTIETFPDNERIYNVELGYRTGVGDLGIDVALFRTKINNRLATIYEGAIAVQKPLGTNVIMGGELGLVYAPSSVKGLLLKGSITIQNAEFDEFKIPVTSADPTGNFYGNTLVDEGFNTVDSVQSYSIDLKGNQLPRVPSTILNLSASYDQDYFGLNASLNLFANRYADATNLFEQDDITNINLGAYARYPFEDKSSIKLSILVKNVLNTDKALRALYVADNDAVITQRQALDSGMGSAASTFYTGIPFLPRRILLSIAYEF